MIVQTLSTSSWTKEKENAINLALSRRLLDGLCTEGENLNTQLERMYNEEFGDINTALEDGMSIEDYKIKEIMDQLATLVNGHYQIRLPFRQKFPSLPDSLLTAEKRLTWFKRKIQRDPVSHVKYSSVVEKYGTEGSSRQVPDDEFVKLKPIWSSCGMASQKTRGT